MRFQFNPNCPLQIAKTISPRHMPRTTPHLTTNAKSFVVGHSVSLSSFFGRWARPLAPDERRELRAVSFLGGIDALRAGSQDRKGRGPEMCPHYEAP